MSRATRGPAADAARGRSGPRLERPTSDEADPVEVSVIVPCRNAEETVGTLLESLARQSWDGGWEVILADNGSNDGSVRVAERHRLRLPALRVVDASGRIGSAFARNRGARAARGESLAFVDADDTVAPGWLGAIGSALRNHRFVASRFEYEKLNARAEAGLRGRVQSDGLQRLWYSPFRDHGGASGLGVRRNLFLDVGGFDEDLPRLTDTDLCIRLQERGVPLDFAEDARVHVRLRTGAGATFRQAWRWARYNTLLHRRYRKDRPETGPAWRSYLRSWRDVLRHLGNPAWLRAGKHRTLLAWRAGWQIGLLEGALRYRVAPVAKPGSEASGSERRRSGVRGRKPA